MCANRLSDLSADGVKRIQRGQWILKDRADFAATQFAHFFERQIIDTAAIQENFTTGDASRRLEQADHGCARERLAGTGFADHTQHFARRDVKTDVVHRDQRAAPRRKFDTQILDLQ